MFDKKNDVARNKKRADAIVYAADLILCDSISPVI